MSVQSEHEKQYALLVQKADFLERTIADKDSNEVKQTAEIKAMQKRLSEQHKDITAKFEQQLREANNAKYEADEKVHDLQSSLESLEQRFQFEQQRWTEQETDLKSQVESTKVLLKSIEEREDGKTEERKQRILDLEVLLEEMKSKNADGIRDMESKLSEQKEESSYVSIKLEKDIAVLTQKIEFQEVQNAQLTS